MKQTLYQKCMGNTRCSGKALKKKPKKNQKKMIFIFSGQSESSEKKCVLRPFLCSLWGDVVAQLVVSDSDPKDAGSNPVKSTRTICEFL